MKYLTFAIVFSLATAFALSATAQTPSDQTSSGLKAMQNATASGKYLFVCFWKEKNAQTDKVWNALQSSAAKYADSAEVVSVHTTDPGEKAIVEKFNISKAPMPLILSIGPTGAVTKAFPGNFDEKQLASAFVSPCEEQCMKAIQSNKLVFVCVAYEVPADGQAAVPQGVKDFQSDKQYAKVTEIVTVNATDKREVGFLKELSVNMAAKKPVSVLLAPGALIGTFDSAADKKQIVAKLASAQSGCAGGNCGPNGCGPKK